MLRFQPSEWTERRTDSIALPAPASLSVAGAVHHVALFVALGKFLVYFIVNAINDALVCSQKRGNKGSKAHLVYWEDANWNNGLTFENNLIGFVLGACLTSQLWISNATPLPAAVAQARALHHVTHNVMAFVPLVTNTVHYPITGGAQLLMGYEEKKKKGRCFITDIFRV